MKATKDKIKLVKNYQKKNLSHKRLPIQTHNARDMRPPQSRLTRTFSKNTTLSSYSLFNGFSSPQLADKEVIYGINPVRLALKSNRRKLIKLYISKGLSTKKHVRRDEIIELTQKNSLPVSHVDSKLIDKVTGEANHQGFLLLTGFLPQFDAKDLFNAKNINHLIALDQVQDPQNLGAIIRSAGCFGFDGIITSANRSSRISATVSKSSAGILELFDIYKVTNLAQSLQKLKDNGFWILGTDVEGKDIYEFTPPKKFVLVLGNEHKGIRQNVLKQSDWVLSIPNQLKDESLNVSVAAGIVMSALTHKKSTG
ncbi:MAG: 23S rRNA (guanosine(2251)-2'-O)-methyltransferase RlmB [SAR324 cluster bacterium]|nr:23S rRNA (guanosine(2251)-2'-O)-methyltransferase RlmB [SAR324 cluster bacterium]